MYKVELADGTIIDAELNGNNFIPAILDKHLFEDNLEEITITDDNGEVETFYNQKVQFARVGNKETFIFLSKKDTEIEIENLQQLLADLTEVTLLGGENSE